MNEKTKIQSIRFAIAFINGCGAVLRLSMCAAKKKTQMAKLTKLPHNNVENGTDFM